MMSLNINKKFLVTAQCTIKGVFSLLEVVQFIYWELLYVLLTSLKIKTCPTGVWDINLNGI